MKKTKLYAKKSLSVFMALMMLMTAWVFVAPEKASAASNYPVTVKFSNSTSNPSGHMYVYYYNVNSDGSIDTSNTSQKVLIISSISGNGYGASGSQSAGPFDIPGWPWKIEIRVESGTVRFLGLYVGNIEVTGMVANNNEGYNIKGAITKSWAYNDNTNLSSGSISKKNWNFPAVSSVRSAPAAQTISVPKGGSASKTFTATFNDQYGIQWPSSNGISATLASNLSGTSVALSGNTATVSANESVFANGGYNASNGQIKTTLNMTQGGITASCDVVFQAPKYNVYLKNFAGTTVKTYSNIGYYNQSVALTDLPANTATSQIAGDYNYHQPYQWPANIGNAFYITEDTTYNEVKATPVNHNYGAWSQAADSHSRTCSECGYVQTQDHVKGTGYVTKAETCTEDGVMTYDCTVCGKTAIETSTINNISGHDFSGEIIENVTGENGNHWQKCTRCDVYGWAGVEDACQNHNWDNNGDNKVDSTDAVSFKASTCEEAGYENYECKVCKATYTKTLELAAHTITATAAKDVTTVCGGDGNAAFWSCSVCSKVWKDAALTDELADTTDADGDTIPDALETKGPAHSFTGAYVSVTPGENGTHKRQCARFTQCNTYGPEEKHDWGTPAVTPSSCTSEGKEVYTCNLCPQTYEVTLEKADHSMTTITAVIPECGKAGNNEYYSCSTCGKFYKDAAGTQETTVAAERLPALEHKWTAHHEYDTLKTPASCQAAAVYNNHCDYCKVQLTGATHPYGTPDTVNGHNFGGEIQKNADGSHSYKCLVAGCSEYGAKTTCTFTKVKEDVASTCNSVGYTILECTLCGNEKREVKTDYDFTNHTGGTEVRNIIEAKCNTNGYTGNTYCLGCGAMIANGETIVADKTVHPHENMIDYEGKVSTCQTEGYKAYRYCDQCGTYEIPKEAVAKKAHSFTNYVTNNNGTHTATCDTCDAAVATPVTDTQDCTGGTANCVDKKVCSECESAYGEVDAANHKTRVFVAKSPATCQKEGTESYYRCTACNTNIDTPVTIEKLDHVYGAWSKIDGEDKHVRACTTCDEAVAAVATQTADCNGGVAYCNALARCVDCKATYGALDADNHSTEANTLKNEKAATCQAPGYTGDYHYDCCDAVKQAGTATEQLAHTFDIEVEGSRKAATCIEKGEVIYKCSTCVESEGVTAATTKEELAIDPNNHASEETVIKNKKAATCESDGHTGDVYYKCCYDETKTEAENRKALKEKGTTIKANGQHVYGDAVPEYMIKEIAETKDDEGKVISRTIVPVDAEPTYAEKIAARRADGKWYHAQICTICYEVVYSACYTYAHTYNCVDTDTCEVCDGLCSLIDADVHKGDLELIDKDAVKATCIADGKKAYYQCADCKKTYFDEAGKNALDLTDEDDLKKLVISKNTVSHTWDDGVETEGTCGTPGKVTYKCTVTGCTATKEISTGIESQNHTWKADYDVIKEASCGTNGYKAIKCEICGAIKPNSSVIIPATEEHDYDKNEDGKVDRDDAVIVEGENCQKPGTLTYTCTECGYEDVQIDTEGVSAHQWSEWATIGGDCTTGVVQERECTVCHIKEQQTVSTDNNCQWELVIRVEPTKENDGYELYRCKNCGDEKTEVISATGEKEHTLDEEKYTVRKEATCKSPEIRRYVCLSCGETVEKEYGEPLSHVWLEQPEEMATCTKDGHSSYYRCVRINCGAEYGEGKVIYPATGHADNDGNGKCDACNAGMYGENGEHGCNCICHKEGWFMQLIYKIVRFFWKLFKIGYSCDCGATHY